MRVYGTFSTPYISQQYSPFVASRYNHLKLVDFNRMILKALKNLLTKTDKIRVTVASNKGASHGNQQTERR